MTGEAEHERNDLDTQLRTIFPERCRNCGSVAYLLTQLEIDVNNGTITRESAFATADQSAREVDTNCAGPTFIVAEPPYQTCKRGVFLD